MLLRNRFCGLAALVFLSLWISCGSEDSNPVDGGGSGDGAANRFKCMVLIEAEGDSFEMGSVHGNADEAPVHWVKFTRDFWMDTTEVAQGDYDEVMSAAYPGYATPGWNAPYGVGDSYPAYYLYWGDAVLYCNARSKRDGFDTVYAYTSITGTPGNLCELVGVSGDLSKNGYRLPTEAEWEYACRAGTTTDFHWGKDYDPYPETSGDSTEVSACAVWYANAWFFGSDDPRFGTHPVATKPANAYHLRDMSGNVYEWCHDWYGAYEGDAQIDPAGPASGSYHVVRGGSWGTYAGFLRSSNRTFSSPGYQYYFLGFRVVRSKE